MPFENNTFNYQVLEFHSKYNPGPSHGLHPYQFLMLVWQNPPPPWSRRFLSLPPFPSKIFVPQGAAETGGEGGGMATSRSFPRLVTCRCCRGQPPEAGPVCRLWSSCNRPTTGVTILLTDPLQVWHACQQTHYRCDMPVNRPTTGVTCLLTDILQVWHCQQTHYRCDTPVNRPSTGVMHVNSPITCVTSLSTDPLQVWHSCHQTHYRCDTPVNRPTTGVTCLSTDPLQV